MADELLLEMAKWLVKNHGREWDNEPEVIKLSYLGIAKVMYDMTEPIIRKDERERILNLFEDNYEVIQTFGKPSPYITFKVRRNEWQALKGKK